MTGMKHLMNINNHPLLSGKYMIPTASILSFMDELSEWINNRYPGGIVTGLQRHGKSSAIAYITTNLPEQLGRELSVFSFECKKHQTASEGRFFEDMLLQSKHKFPSSGTSSKKRARLVEFIVEKAKAVEGVLVIILDEAQKMELSYYEYLADFHNDIVAAGFSPLFVLVGQPELIHVRSSLRTAKKNQIIGRFMLCDHHFHGLTNLDAIAAALHAYDDQTEYPDGSKCSFSKFFFPVAFEAGWRLMDEATHLKKAFDDCSLEINVKQSSDIPMQYFCTAVENFFRKYHNEDSFEFKGSIRIWKDLVSTSGYMAAGAEMHHLDEVSTAEA